MAVPFKTLESITRNYIIPTVIDQLSVASPLMERILKRKKGLTGMKVEQPVEFAYNPLAGAWQGGYAVLPFQTPEIITKAQHDYAYYQCPVVWAETDVLKNAGAEAIADYAEVITKNARKSMMETFGRDLYKDGSVNALGARTIDGLSAICTYNGNPAPGAYGGIDRSSSTGTRASYTNNAWWNAQVVAVNAGSVARWQGTFNFSNASTVIDMRKMNQFMLMFPEPPDAFYTSFPLFGKLWDLNQANEKIERSNGGDKYDVGARKIFINGIPVFPDILIDNENKIYGISHDEITLRVSKDFEAGKMKNPTRQRIVGTHIFFDGQLTCGQPQMQGLMTGATAQ